MKLCYPETSNFAADANFFHTTPTDLLNSFTIPPRSPAAARERTPPVADTVGLAASTRIVV
jgi:hypothetical protein